MVAPSYQPQLDISAGMVAAMSGSAQVSGHDFSCADDAQSSTGVLDAEGKRRVLDDIRGKRPSAAKAAVGSVGVMRGLKPPPPSVWSFLAVCEAVP